jgi:hypothetical protein
MKQTRGIELPASFMVTVSHAGTEILQAAPAENDILTVAEVAELLKCKPSSIYNLTRHCLARRIGRKRRLRAAGRLAFVRSRPPGQCEEDASRPC